MLCNSFLFQKGEVEVLGCVFKFDILGDFGTSGTQNLSILLLEIVLS